MIISPVWLGIGFYTNLTSLGLPTCFLFILTLFLGICYVKILFLPTFPLFPSSVSLISFNLMRRYFCRAGLLAAPLFGSDGVRRVAQVSLYPTWLLTKTLILNQSTNMLDVLLQAVTSLK